MLNLAATLRKYLPAYSDQQVYVDRLTRELEVCYNGGAFSPAFLSAYLIMMSFGYFKRWQMKVTMNCGKSTSPSLSVNAIRLFTGSSKCFFQRATVQFLHG